MDYNYDVIKVRNIEGFKWVTQDEAISKFKNLFMGIERVCLTRKVLFEKNISNKKIPAPYEFENEAINYYNKSFQREYKGMMNLTYYDICLYNTSVEREAFILKRFVMIEKMGSSTFPSDTEDDKIRRKELREVRRLNERMLLIILIV